MIIHIMEKHGKEQQHQQQQQQVHEKKVTVFYDDETNRQRKIGKSRQREGEREYNINENVQTN